jgi:uncharacterized repeat protein (TIGR03803 family)
VESIRLSTVASVMAACLMTLLAAQSVQAQTYTVLYTFTGWSDGGNPAGVIQDAKGNLYGTTFEGGDFSNSCSGLCGVVFKLSKTGKETVLHNFTDYPDGKQPLAGVIRDAEGNLYGTTDGGGTHGAGAVFKLSRTGKETALYNFCSANNCEDGGYPAAGVIEDAKGNLYGTTAYGGVGSSCTQCGTVFKLSKTGKHTVLYRFTGGADGGYPLGGVIQDAQGNLYGTTFYGGDLSCNPPNGCGVVFKLSKMGKETVLHSFTGGADGGNPSAGLIQDTKRNFYGTTENGGDLSCISGGLGCGVVFKLSKTGRETVLHSFTGGADGWNPSGVIQDTQGNLYGTTYYGGHCGNRFGCGTVFEVSKTGRETVLYRFCSQSVCSDGLWPQAALIRDAQGNLYGTTYYGGNESCWDHLGCGVVFKLTP